jgi:hypothetical protein
MGMPAADQLVPLAVVAAVVALGLGILFGLDRRTTGVAVLVAVAVHAFYPGGASGLIVAALRPLRFLTDVTAERDGAHRAEIADAAGDPAPPR